VIANPPYSIKKWNQNAWTHDPFGRNNYGIPPKGNADYAFFQHIICSMKLNGGRFGILYPNGILERDAEKSMRQKIVEDDIIECVVGLGKDLFYNSSMESCLVFGTTKKKMDRVGKILFIDAKDFIKREKSQSFLTVDHIDKIYEAYLNFKDIEGFAKVTNTQEVLNNEGNLNIRLYVPDMRYVDKELLNTPLGVLGSQDPD